MPAAPPTAKTEWIGKYRAAETNILWALFIAIGLLQMKRVHLGVITDYGADVFCPALLFVLTRQGKSLLRYIGLRQDRPVVIAAGVFGLSAAWEVAQRLHWIPGTFDPCDLLAYAIGVTVPFLTDRWLRARDKLQAA